MREKQGGAQAPPIWSGASFHARRLFFDDDRHSRDIFELEVDFLPQAGVLEDEHQAQVLFGGEIDVLVQDFVDPNSRPLA